MHFVIASLFNRAYSYSKNQSSTLQYHPLAHNNMNSQYLS